jgi:DNA-binding winged helix-turn-helix (wHTH) protein
MLYVFGDYTLDTQLYELRHTSIPVKLQPRVYSMLVYLVQRRHRVVPRQDLFEYLWPDRFVSDASLESCIAATRRAVGDSGRAQRIIQTLHCVGYRFVATVEEYPLGVAQELVKQNRPQGQRMAVRSLKFDLAKPSLWEYPGPTCADGCVERLAAISCWQSGEGYEHGLARKTACTGVGCSAAVRFRDDD